MTAEGAAGMFGIWPGCATCHMWFHVFACQGCGAGQDDTSPHGPTAAGQPQPSGTRAPALPDPCLPAAQPPDLHASIVRAGTAAVCMPQP